MDGGLSARLVVPTVAGPAKLSTFLMLANVIVTSRQMPASRHRVKRRQIDV
jgi:hypothetical protein